MEDSMLFIIFTFIIIVIVIITADSLTTAMLIVSILTNFLVISAHFGKISKNILNLSLDSEQDKHEEHEEQSGHGEQNGQVASKLSINEPSIYQDLDDDYKKWHQYHTSYTDSYNQPRPVAPPISASLGYNIDSANALMAQRRARDKKCSDGWASKDANYYKHHFADELAISEAKPWWGRDEF